MSRIVFALALLVLPATVVAQSPDRAHLDRLAQRVDAALDSLSAPTPLLLATPPTRAYRVPGLGAFVVLSPRLLSAASLAERTPRTLADHPALSPASGRAQLERALLELHSTLQRQAEAAQRVHTAADLQALQHQARERLAAAARARAQAQQALAAAMQNVTFPQIVAPGFAPVRDDGPTPLVSPRSMQAARSPAEAVARVRAALASVLAAEAAAAGFLAPGENLAVTVDLVGPGGGTPERTLVVRAAATDLRAAARGEIPAADLASRLEVLEY